jgi:hypothetical protein
MEIYDVSDHKQPGMIWQATSSAVAILAGLGLQH